MANYKFKTGYSLQPLADHIPSNAVIRHMLRGYSDEWQKYFFIEGSLVCKKMEKK